jgi:2-polyprenyl-3-methyl-5-hydroxy-6-metoxy-1,4-benzoquinol methylase
MSGRSFRADSKWQMRRCPACASDKRNFLFEKEGVTIDNCCECDTAYVNPEPPKDLLDALYNHYGMTYFTQAGKLEVDFRAERYRRELRLVPKEVRKGCLLDVGCSTGSFLKVAKSIGFEEVKGIDVARDSVASANALLGEGVAVVGDFLQRPFREEQFDAITLWATLEHVPQPEEFIREAYRVLKPNGTLFVSLPNRRSLPFLLLGKKWDMVSIEHLNYYTPRSIERLLRKCGLSIAATKTYSFNPIRFLHDVRRSGEEQPTIETQINTSRRTGSLREITLIRWAEQAVDSLVSLWDLGELIVVAARKGR